MPLHIIERTKSIRHYTWRQPPGPPVRAQDAVFLGPLLVGTLAAVSLIAPPQAREVYLATFADGNGWGTSRALCGLFGVLLLSATLFAWNARLVDSLRDDRFHAQPSLVVDRGLRDFRTLKALCAAALPILGLIIGLQLAVPDILTAADHVGSADKDLVKQLKDAERQIYIASAICFLAGALLLMSMLALKFTRWTAGILKGSWLVLALILCVPAALSPMKIVSLAQWLGPIGTTSLVLIAVIPTLRVVGGILHWIARYPLAFVITLIARVLGIWLPASLALIVGVVALVSYIRQEHEEPNIKPRSATRFLNEPPSDSQHHEKVFVQWLEANRQAWLERHGYTEERFAALPANEGPRFPVFIVAAQGGGIYAAASAMALLTRLQDHCNSLHQNIFAISAVSGGALGSAIYRGLAAEAKPAPGCTPTASGKMFGNIRPIATADHLSGLLLSAPIDWLSKLPALIVRLSGGGYDAGPNATWLQTAGKWIVELEQSRRDQTLASSFSETFSRSAPSGTDSELAIKASEYWRPHRSRTPALLMASTSVETGHRIIHSPFSLSLVGDGTLQSFQDLNRHLAFDKTSRKRIQDQSIIGAAVTSARFPGVLPAWPIWHSGRVDERRSEQRLRLNFVDGGYADSSGTTTAADLVRRLRQFIVASTRADAPRPPIELAPQQSLQAAMLARVDIHVIVLTDTEVTQGLSTANGTNFPDTWAPVAALFSARRLAASSALASARRDMTESLGQTCDKKAGSEAGGDDPNCPIHTITLDHEIFKLPLGWLLSNTSNQVMLSMLGSPDNLTSPTDCTQAAIKDLKTHFAQVARRNGCTQRRIIDVLSR